MTANLLSDASISTLASMDFGWLSIFAASGSIALIMGITIMVTVWLTGGFGNGN